MGLFVAYYLNISVQELQHRELDYHYIAATHEQTLKDTCPDFLWLGKCQETAVHKQQLLHLTVWSLNFLQFIDRVFESATITNMAASTEAEKEKYDTVETIGIHIYCLLGVVVQGGLIIG